MTAADGSPEANWVAYQNMLLRYYGHYSDPEALTDEAWALAIQQLKHIRQAENNV
jgi:hypothetical protein